MAETNHLNKHYVLICLKILVIVTALLSIGYGLYLCFGSQSEVHLDSLYKRLLALGIIMISFGFAVTTFTVIPRFLCVGRQDGGILECGSILTFAASLLPLVIAFITYYLPLNEDVLKEMELRRTLPSTRKLQISLSDATELCNPYSCLVLLERCALLQMIIILLSIANGLSLNTLAVVEEYYNIKGQLQSNA